MLYRTALSPKNGTIKGNHNVYQDTGLGSLFETVKHHRHSKHYAKQAGQKALQKAQLPLHRPVNKQMRCVSCTMA